MTQRQDHAAWNSLDEETKPHGGILLAILAICMVSLVYSCAGAATITWGCAPPTQNEDGTAVTGPLTYKVRWGTSWAKLNDNLLPLTCTNPTSITVPDPPGIAYYISDVAINDKGIESQPSSALRIISRDAPAVKIDCVVSAYGEWTVTPWTTCDSGIQSRQETHSRTITTQPSGGGAACPTLSDSRTVTQPCVIPMLTTVGGDVFIASPTPDFTNFGYRPWKLGVKAGTIAPKIVCDANRRIGEDWYRVTAAIIWSNGKKPYVVAQCERKS